MSDRDAGATKAALAGHLRWYAELGIQGVSHDASWRERGGALGSSGSRASGLGPQVSGDGPRASDDTSAPASEAGGPRPETSSYLADLKAYIGPDCTRCKLGGLGRRQVVFGAGNPRAELMFIGEAPGADEDVQGEPFVGRAGQLLTKIIEAIDLKREDVYIANVIKCRPPGNRAPEPDEVATCKPFLFQQIDAIRPRVIVALGTHAAHALLETDAPISRLRGHMHGFRGGIKLVPTFHPAFLLRSPDRKRDVWEDMKKVRTLLQEDQ